MNSDISSFQVPEITLFITTQQIVSTFTIKTLISGLDGFTETVSGVYARTDVARSGVFTYILLQLPSANFDISVQSDGNSNLADRQKGFAIEAENSDDELTVYALTEGSFVSADAFMAISCQAFVSAREYRYFIFGALGNNTDYLNQILITPCEDDTTITVTPSQIQSHPSWVEPGELDMTSLKTSYQMPFNRFDTLMLTNLNDLTGTIITSTKPLSVFTGHQCGKIVGDTCDHLVEQIPPHVTYGDMFLLAPFDVRQSGEVYRIGTTSDNTEVELNCLCEPRTVLGNRVGLTGVDRMHTAVLNRGEYIECQTPPVESRTFCSVQSSRPVTVMSYTLSATVDNLEPLPNLPFFPIGDPSIVYIPPVLSYLSEYSVTSLVQRYPLFFSYVTSDTQSSHSLTVNNDVFNSTRSSFECNACNSTIKFCGQGGFGYLGNGNFNISSMFSFWGYAYGFAREVSYAFPLPFKQMSIGCEFNYQFCLFSMHTL